MNFITLKKLMLEADMHQKEKKSITKLVGALKNERKRNNLRKYMHLMAHKFQIPFKRIMSSTSQINSDIANSNIFYF